MTEQTKAWLVQGEITCPEVAEQWGRNIGDAEFRLLDHPEKPGSSADFPSRKSAMDWAKGKGVVVVDLTVTDILRDFAFYGHTGVAVSGAICGADNPEAVARAMIDELSVAVEGAS